MNITDKSFTMMQTDDPDDGFAIRIDEGKFANVMYTMGSVKVTEDGMQASMSFDFTPLNGNMTYKVQDLNGNKELEEVAGQILKYMLEVSINDALENIQETNGSE